LTGVRHMLQQAASSAPGHPCQLGVGRSLHTSSSCRGLEEFFPVGAPDENFKSGRAWLARDLRHKSNVELHQLWYILVKERNMLLTVKQEALVHRQPFPAPERLRKIRQSMKAVKVVIAERDRVAKLAAQQDPETWQQLRAEVEVDTGLRKQVGSEKKGRVKRAAPAIVDEVEMSDKQFQQLLGVERPGRAVPGQPQRPMRKDERTQFRRELQARRQDIVAAKKEAVETELKDLGDDLLEPIVREAEAELVNGWDLEELTYRHYFALTEARRRDMDTIYTPRELAHTRDRKAIGRVEHGIKAKAKARIKQRTNLV